MRSYLDIDALMGNRSGQRLRLRPSRVRLPFRKFRFREAMRGRRSCIFIGPRPETLALFGDKTKAREIAGSLGIPIVPGSPEAVASAAEAASVRKVIGYPVLLKAAAGGGGRGMRAVADGDEIAILPLRDAKARRRPPSATARSSSKNSSRGRVILKFRSWQIPQGQHGPSL